MYFFRLIISTIVVLMLLYYFMVVLQCFNIITFTNRKLTFKRMLVPFYYWFAPINETSKK